MEHSVAAMILGGPKDEEKETSEGDEFETVAAEIILGVNERNPKVLAKGLKAFFSMCDAEPHEEGEHLEDGF